MRLKMVLVSSSHGTYLIFLGEKSAHVSVAPSSPWCLGPRSSCRTKLICLLGAQMFVAPHKQVP